MLLDYRLSKWNRNLIRWLLSPSACQYYKVLSYDRQHPSDTFLTILSWQTSDSVFVETFDWVDADHDVIRMFVTRDNEEKVVDY